MLKKSFLGVLLLFLCVIACQKEQSIATPASIDFKELPYKNLSEYGFFIGDIADLLPHESVLAYAPSSSLFSDYAHKSRFIWMPKGVQASISEREDGALIFPDNSILIKNFYYPENPKGEKKIMETRLLVKVEGEWQSYPYLWNEDQSGAFYKITGASLMVHFQDEEGVERNIDYLQPNKNQCKSCHNKNEKLMPIGPKVRNLNYDFDYGKGVIENQLLQWTKRGFLIYDKTDDHSQMVNYTDETAPLELRAKAYLDMNCGHCHNSESPASTSGLFLTYEESNLMKWGVYKTPVAAGIGAGPHTFDIYPSKADSSILVYRMKSTQAGVAMPEIGRTTIDDKGVELVSQWIDSMTQ